tara:strand:- start:2255 stop:2428 length:174 start_codon:yes stop_codon:yes gene_type:complete
MIKYLKKISILLLLVWTLTSCHQIANVFYNPDMCKAEKKRKGKFKQKDMDRRAKSGQ